MSFNYSITADTHPSPTRPDCKIKPSNSSCFVGIAWYDDRASNVAYSADDPYFTEIAWQRSIAQ